MSPDAQVDRLVRLFETFRREDVARLGDFYGEDAWFKDPFNEVRGLPGVQRVFTHMFESLESPRFVVTERIVQDKQCFLAWEFWFLLRGRQQVVRGGSHLRLATDGRVQWHRDYWDAAEEVYEKLPVLGALMRWLKKRAAA